MNDTPNKELSLTLAILVFLLAIIVLGVVIWQTILLDEQSRSLEKRFINTQPSSLLRANARSPEEKASGPTVIRYTDPQKKKVNTGESVTYLFDNLDTFIAADESACTTFAKIANDGSYAPSDADILENENVVRYIGDRFGDYADDFMRGINGTLGNRKLDRICDVDGKTWVTMTQDFSSVEIYQWIVTQMSAYLSALSPALQTMDLSYGIYPDVNGAVMASTGYGDAGYVQWRFFQFDEVSNQFDLVEDCTGNILYDEISGTFDDSGFEFTCTREYKP